MKYHVAFLAGLIAILGVFSYLTFSMNENGLLYLHGEREDLAQVLATFQRQLRRCGCKIRRSRMISKKNFLKINPA